MSDDGESGAGRGDTSDPLDDLSGLWRWFADEQCHGYSPLYEQLCRSVAEDRDLLQLVAGAPPAAHLPLSLLASVHYLVLEGHADELADIYGGRSDADPFPPFRRLCLDEHRAEVEALMAVRRIQTNECGRSALIAPSLTWIARILEAPLALVDVGCSAGLNLLCDEMRFDYGAHGATGPLSSPVAVQCRVVAGDPPIAHHLPRFAARVGIDRSPVRLNDPDDARWLVACVWPDTGRLDRTAAAIELVRANPPSLVAGDANEALPGVLSELPDGSAVVVMTTWAFAYFSVEDRRTFESLLATASADRPVAWLSAEGRGTVSSFSDVTLPRHDHTEANVLGLLWWRDGQRHEQLLGFGHQHGVWLDWRAPTG